MAWKQINIRVELYDRIAERAQAEDRSVAKMGDLLLRRALDNGDGINLAYPPVRVHADLAAKVKPDPRKR